MGGEADKVARKRKRELAKKVLEKKKVAAVATAKAKELEA